MNDEFRRFIRDVQEQSHCTDEAWYCATMDCVESKSKREEIDSLAAVNIMHRILSREDCELEDSEPIQEIAHEVELP